MLVPLLYAISCGDRFVVDGVKDIVNLTHSGAKCLLVHQSWITEEIPEKYRSLTKTWQFPEVRNVLWTDKGNLELIEHFYPMWLSQYKRLLDLPKSSGGPVMASDWARLLYLHKFGGIYVDLDYEAHLPPPQWPVVQENSVFQSHRENAPIFFVNSPFLITEVMQNSLMYSPSSGHPFLYQVCKSIAQTLDFIENPYCPDDSTVRKEGVSAACPTMNAFSNRWTKSVTWLLKTEQITGPPVLDKTYTQLSLSNNPDVRRVYSLPTNEYFGTVGSNSIGPGKYATHWHANSWVTLNPVRLMPTLSITVVVGFALTLFLAYKYGQNERLTRSRCMRSESKFKPIVTRIT